MTQYGRERDALNDLSAHIGSDPALVQAAGGNTSVKQDGTLWIKASGTWLMHAQERDIMVPVALEPLLEALGRNDMAAEKAQDFVLHNQNPSGLRPSIETTVHAIFPKKYVIHVHCVETIALSVRRDAEALIAPRLEGFNWAFVPYIRPGLPLSRIIAAKLRPMTDVVILGNHGLVVAGETLDEASRLLNEVSEHLASEMRPPTAPDVAALESLAAGSDYLLPADKHVHAVATDQASCAFAEGGSLYPDHVIFLGAGSVVASSGENAASVQRRLRGQGAHDPLSILFPGKGVLMHESASESALAMARCLSDVTARIPPGAIIRYLTDTENDQLLNWDAEKYRISLGAAGAK